MDEIKTVSELRLAILELEAERRELWPVVKEQMLETADLFKPHNIVKTTFRKLFFDQDLKAIVFNSVLGVTTGLIANSVLRQVALGPASKFVAGTLMGMVSNKRVLQHSPGILSAGNTIIKRLFTTT